MDNEGAVVLVVDDDALIQEMLKRVIANKGIKCQTCSGGDEAVKILNATKSIKLVLLDINMPEMSGDELLSLLKKNYPSINVIMITGYQDMEVAKKCMNLGAKDFITKPFDLEYLETSVMTQIIPLI